FTRPYPFDPTVVVDVGPVWESKVALLHAHQSQFYEWLPFNAGYVAEVPDADEDRRVWLSDRMQRLDEEVADRYRDRLVAAYGPHRGAAVRMAEAFEGCEYGAPLDEAAVARLFPFATGRP